MILIKNLIMEKEKMQNTFILKKGSIISNLPCEEFKLIGIDNQLYIFKIYKGEKFISFHIKEIRDIHNISYKIGLLLQEFYDLIPPLSSLSIDELFVLFVESIKESGISINKKENKIHLNLIVEIMGRKEEISLFIEPEKAKIDDEINELKEKIKKMEILNGNLKNEFEQFKNIVNEKINFTLKSEMEKVQRENDEKIKNLENKLVEKDNHINQLKNEIKLFKNDFDDLKDKGKLMSKIITFSDLFFIEQGFLFNFNKKIKKLNLLYRDSTEVHNNSQFKIFHEKCEGKDYTLVLVMSRNGKKFGGFTDLPWGQRQNIHKGFIFSIDNERIFYDVSYINTSKYEGPNFEGFFRIKYDENGSKVCYINNNNLEEGNKCYFSELEVYKVFLE